MLRRSKITTQKLERAYFIFGQQIGKESVLMFAYVIRLIREWKRYNRGLNELSRLDDRELADIGISRCDIPRVAWNAAHER